MRSAIHKSPRWTRLQGFTLLELMITVSILAILLAIAVPSFTSTIRSNQIETTTNGLVGALSLARSEASKRGTSVSVCASTNGTSCSGGTDWSTGWIVFMDTGVIGTIEPPADLTIKNLVSSASGMSVVGSDPFVNYVSTGAVNFATAATVTFTVSKSGCGTNDKRTITVQVTTGRSSLVRSNCP